MTCDNCQKLTNKTHPEIHRSRCFKFNVLVEKKICNEKCIGFNK